MTVLAATIVATAPRVGLGASIYLFVLRILDDLFHAICLRR